MASSAASEGILFIGAITIAVAFVGIMSGVIAGLGEDVRSQGERVSEELRTDITIINDPDAMITSPLTLYIKNTGTTTVSTGFVTVLLDGQASTNTTLDVLESTNDDELPPGMVLEIEVNDLSAGPGDHRARIVTENGVEDSLFFNV